MTSGEPVQPEQPVLEPTPVGHSVARVLVIDDEAEIGHALRLGLVGAHFAVEWAATAEGGSDLVTRWHPDVIILDLTLPDRDGLEVCRQLRTWTAVPIIVLSVRGSDQDKITALENGADDYLTKPFSMGELLARVRVALRHAAHTAGGGTALSEATYSWKSLHFLYKVRIHPYVFFTAHGLSSSVRSLYAIHQN